MLAKQQEGNFMSPQIAQRIVKTFVDKYINEGRIEAGNYISRVLTTEQQVQLREEVKNEFRARGYVFDKDKPTDPKIGA